MISFIVIPRILQPERTLNVGSQVDDSVYQYTKHIEDKEKIVEYEKWFDGIEFSNDIEEPTGYAEIVVDLVNHKEGTMVHPISIWIDGEDITVINNIGFKSTEFETPEGKLTKTQLDKLRKIIK
ncbi:hypothetical protein [Alkalibacterium kapii]|uniref:Uncharacterized protein n=1 Tax=Alkalibacterium kapii TaxID=426704 RepID=A0A511ASQ5_9LACT|nr:hypothetical protein [Alkalibacterium kapii]GEK91234.1 hypothetical protein AKA01nite_08560 [Alkalibacterium kapii]